MRRLILIINIIVLLFSFSLNFCFAADNNLSFNENELEFIKNNPIITMGVDPNFLPFEFFDKDGIYKGITSDYLDLIKNKTGLQFQIVEGLTWPEAYEQAVNGDIDMLSSVSKTPERERHFIFSQPYYYIKRVIAVKDTEISIKGFKDLDGQLVAVQKNSSHHSYLLSFPNINLSVYESVEEAITAVANGTEKAFVGNIATTNYLIRANGITNLKFTAFETDESQALYIAVRKDWPELVGILDKALLSITEEEKIAINNKWIDLKTETDFGPIFQAIFIITIFASILSFVSVYWISRLKKEVEARKQIQDDLEVAKAYIESALCESERSKEVILSNLPGLAYRCNYDREWTMQFVSEGCYELTGYKPNSLVNNNELSFNDLISPKYRLLLWNEWEKILRNKQSFRYEYEIITKQGQKKWVLELGQGIYDEQDNIIALEGIVFDISDRKEKEDELKYLSVHNEMTGLYNQRFFEELIDKESYLDLNCNRAVLLINLNKINSVSLTYGYNYSKNLINELTNSLSKQKINNSVLFQISFERFVYYINDYVNRNELIFYCNKIFNIIKEMQILNTIGCSIGVLEIDTDDWDVESIIKNASVAAEKANENKTFEYCFYDDLKLKVTRENEIKEELFKIINQDNNEELFLQYQPIVELNTNKIISFEALLRFKSNKLGFVNPVEFIPIAEEMQLIVPIGIKVLNMACKFIKRLELSGYDNLRVSVNVSVLQLLGDEFLDDLAKIINEAKIKTKNLGIEITETVFSDNYETINEKLGKLIQMGIEVSIDDFGTGYSSLFRESELNVNCLKIDKYFIDSILSKKPEEVITADIISMAHKMGHTVVAEGVEHEKQKQYLIDNYCDFIQGYIFSKPLDEENAIKLLSRK